MKSCQWCENPVHIGYYDFFPNIISYDKELNQNPQCIACIRKSGGNYALHIEETYLEDNGEFSSGTSMNVPIHYCPECGRNLYSEET